MHQHSFHAIKLLCQNESMFIMNEGANWRELFTAGKLLTVVLLLISQEDPIK